MIDPSVSARPPLIALTPPGLLDPSVAIAASRAGELGVLDLEYIADTQRAREAIEKLVQFAPQPCGVKLDSEATDFVEHILSVLPQQVRVVLFTPSGQANLRAQIQKLHSLDRMVLVEVTSVDEAQFAIDVGADGLIAKGNEAGGRVGEETTFVLLQRLLTCTRLPVWAQGGIGLHTAAACYAAGAAGVVLDSQLALARESSLPATVQASIGRMDGSETVCLGGKKSGTYRLYTRPGLAPVAALHQLADSFANTSATVDENASRWRQAIQARVGWDTPEEHIWLIGQDAAFASVLAERFRTVAGILAGMREAISLHIQTAQRLQSLNQEAPLAQSHGTRYPIVQGPMTRVSDKATFALQVADGGALPFLALALMRAPEVDALLHETQQLLGERPWGVGILGFVPQDLRQEQMEVIRAYAPDFALIAGGRPDQALALQQAGTTTYLHVPSPELLKWFVSSGTRHFVFEGRECGGHVGPRSSFVLWDSMIDTLLDAVPSTELAECHVLFAGGVHDAVSSVMVAAMAAPLAERGVKIGVLMGTAYLFTEEAVVSGAITKQFQQEAVQCTQTVLLETGPGHATRCVETPYVQRFEELKGQLRSADRSPEEIREVLEKLNIGRLRIAAKGLDRHPQFGENAAVPKLRALKGDEQHEQGMYMIGQVAALRDSVCTIASLHREISVEGSARLANLARSARASAIIHRDERPADVAIIGMACLLPKAPDLRTYWQNILNKVDAITEVPEDRWDWRLYFDPDPKTPDKIYSKWGGFLDDVPFDPMRFGMPPNALPSIEPLQLLTLNVVQAALEDAGYADRPFARERTSVILGVGGGAGDLGQQYALRAGLPMALDNPPPELWERLPAWTEDSFPGILANVTAGRVANRFDLGGVNYTVDAACASALAAIYLAVRELEVGTSDMVVVGGADTVQNPFAYLCFSKTHALSPRGRCRTFDESADGIVISEGIAILILKRLADAERDGDRIYAVIKAVSGSSDGRDKGLTAPRPEGQMRSLERAYHKAGISPSTVGLIEAHGTGTVAGDRAEVETLKRVFVAAGTESRRCAIGSVKSMIGHTKCTAGVAGLIKIALALHQKILPPTLHVEKPNAILADSPFYVNSEPRPWLHDGSKYPRRAAVSAFGFGGTNFHAVLEEYTTPWVDASAQNIAQPWASELLLWYGNEQHEFLAAIEPLHDALTRGAQPSLADVAYTLYQQAKEWLAHTSEPPPLCLAVVATSVDDLQQKLTLALAELRKSGPLQIQHPSGIYLTSTPLARAGKIAFLFPGQGSQYPGMMRELALHFAEVCEPFEQADRVLARRLPQPLSTYIFPPPHFSAEEEKAQQQALTQTYVAQPALGAVSLGLLRLLRELEVQPEMVAGHSYGEYVALCTAGVFDAAMLYKLSEARGRCIVEAASQELGTMAAVSATAERVRELLQAVNGVWIANINAPQQTVISGTHAGIEQAIARLAKEGIRTRSLPVACAFHSPLIAPARDQFASVLATVEFSSPALPVFGNALAAPYPEDSPTIAAWLTEHLASPVRFVDEIEAMYEVGARIFIEVGPRNVMTALTEQILGDRPHLAVAIDGGERRALVQLHQALAQLAAQGVALRLDRLYEGREVKRLDFNTLDQASHAAPLSPTTWLVNGSRARPLRSTHANRAKQEPALQQPMPKRAKEQILNTSTENLAAQGIGSSAAVRSNNGLSSSTTGSQIPVSPTPSPEAQPQSTSQPIAPHQLMSGQLAAMPAQDASGQVMIRFQQLMAQFLQTQQQVMLAYLQGAAEAGHAPSEILGAAAHTELSMTPIPPTPAPLPSAPLVPPPVLHPEFDLSRGAQVVGSADSTNGATHSSPRTSAEIATESKPDEAAQVAIWDRERITAQLLELVSERTGYPPEILGLDMNLEADLSIDSIKRVEILGAFQRAHLAAEQMPTQAAMEELTSLKTLRGIIDWFSAALGSGQSVTAREARATSSQNDRVEGDVSRFVLSAVDGR